MPDADAPEAFPEADSPPVGDAFSVRDAVPDADPGLDAPPHAASASSRTTDPADGAVLRRVMTKPSPGSRHVPARAWSVRAKQGHCCRATAGAALRVGA